jgi:phosphatidylinositol glycan class U
MLRPYPSVGDLGLYLSLLLLLQPQLSRFKTGLMLSNSLLFIMVLGPAMWSQWIHSESANSNFFYSISLLLGAWHTFTMVQLVLATTGLEAPV